MSEPHPTPSARLAFRLWSEADLPFARLLFGDPQVTALVGGPFDEATIAARLATELANQRDHGFSYWPILLKDPPEIGGPEIGGPEIGCCGLKPRDPAHRVHELGFYLRPPFWGQGYAVEAAERVIRYAFETLGASALFAGHHPRNDGSRRTLEKLGFRYTHAELYPPTGLQHPGYELLCPST